MLVAVGLTAFSFNLQRLFFLILLLILFREKKNPQTSPCLLKWLFQNDLLIKSHRAIGIQKDHTVSCAVQPFPQRINWPYRGVDFT